MWILAVAGCMRYAQGGGLTAEGRRRREQVRLGTAKRSSSGCRPQRSPRSCGLASGRCGGGGRPGGSPARPGWLPAGRRRGAGWMSSSWRRWTWRWMPGRWLLAFPPDQFGRTDTAAGAAGRWRVLVISLAPAAERTGDLRDVVMELVSGDQPLQHHANRLDEKMGARWGAIIGRHRATTSTGAKAEIAGFPIAPRRAGSVR